VWNSLLTRVKYFRRGGAEKSVFACDALADEYSRGKEEFPERRFREKKPGGEHKFATAWRNPIDAASCVRFIMKWR